MKTTGSQRSEFDKHTAAKVVTRAIRRTGHLKNIRKSFSSDQRLLTYQKNLSKPENWRIKAIHEHQQPERLLSEFTDTFTGRSELFVSIIKSDGSILGDKNFKKICEALSAGNRKILWTLNSNSDLVLGMIDDNDAVLHHSILANANEQMVNILEQSDNWDEASRELNSTWLAENPEIQRRVGKKVISAGEMSTEMIGKETLKLVVDNESENFQPSETSLFGLVRYYKDILLTSLNKSSGTNQFADAERSYVIPTKAFAFHESLTFQNVYGELNPDSYKEDELFGLMHGDAFIKDTRLEGSQHSLACAAIAARLKDAIQHPKDGLIDLSSMTDRLEKSSVKLLNMSERAQELESISTSQDLIPLIEGDEEKSGYKQQIRDLKPGETFELSSVASETPDEAGKSPGETFELTGGWRGSKTGHLMIYSTLQRQPENDEHGEPLYTLSVINTGNGTEKYHPVKTSADGNKQLIQSEIFKKDIPLSALCKKDDPFLQALLEPKVTTHEPWGPDTIYELINKLPGTPVPASTDLKDYSTAQRAGTCTFKPTKKVASRDLTEKEYKRLWLELDIRDMKAFLDKWKSELSSNETKRILLEKTNENLSRRVEKLWTKGYLSETERKKAKEVLSNLRKEINTVNSSDTAKPKKLQLITTWEQVEALGPITSSGYFHPHVFDPRIDAATKETITRSLTSRSSERPQLKKPTDTGALQSLIQNLHHFAGQSIAEKNFETVCDVIAEGFRILPAPNHDPDKETGDTLLLQQFPIESIPETTRLLTECVDAYITALSRAPDPHPERILVISKAIAFVYSLARRCPETCLDDVANPVSFSAPAKILEKTYKDPGLLLPPSDNYQLEQLSKYFDRIRANPGQYDEDQKELLGDVSDHYLHNPKFPLKEEKFRGTDRATYNYFESLLKQPESGEELQERVRAHSNHESLPYLIATLHTDLGNKNLLKGALAPIAYLRRLVYLSQFDILRNSKGIRDSALKGEIFKLTLDDGTEKDDELVVNTSLSQNLIYEGGLSRRSLNPQKQGLLRSFEQEGPLSIITLGQSEISTDGRREIEVSQEETLPVRHSENKAMLASRLGDEPNDTGLLDARMRMVPKLSAPMLIAYYNEHIEELIKPEAQQHLELLLLRNEPYEITSFTRESWRNNIAPSHLDHGLLHRELLHNQQSTLDQLKRLVKNGFAYYNQQNKLAPMLLMTRLCQDLKKHMDLLEIDPGDDFPDSISLLKLMLQNDHFNTEEKAAVHEHIVAFLGDKPQLTSAETNLLLQSAATVEYHTKPSSLANLLIEHRYRQSLVRHQDQVKALFQSQGKDLLNKLLDNMVSITEETLPPLPFDEWQGDYPCFKKQNIIVDVRTGAVYADQTQVIKDYVSQDIVKSKAYRCCFGSQPLSAVRIPNGYRIPDEDVDILFSKHQSDGPVILKKFDVPKNPRARYHFHKDQKPLYQLVEPNQDDSMHSPELWLPEAMHRDYLVWQSTDILSDYKYIITSRESGKISYLVESSSRDEFNVHPVDQLDESLVGLKNCEIDFISGFETPEQTLIYKNNETNQLSRLELPRYGLTFTRAKDGELNWHNPRYYLNTQRTQNPKDPILSGFHGYIELVDREHPNERLRLIPKGDVQLPEQEREKKDFSTRSIIEPDHQYVKPFADDIQSSKNTLDYFEVRLNANGQIATKKMETLLRLAAIEISKRKYDKATLYIEEAKTFSEISGISEGAWQAMRSIAEFYKHNKDSDVDACACRLHLAALIIDKGFGHLPKEVNTIMDKNGDPGDYWKLVEQDLSTYVDGIGNASKQVLLDINQLEALKRGLGLAGTSLPDHVANYISSIPNSPTVENTGTSDLVAEQFPDSTATNFSSWASSAYENYRDDVTFLDREAIFQMDLLRPKRNEDLLLCIPEVVDIVQSGDSETIEQLRERFKLLDTPNHPKNEDQRYRDILKHFLLAYLNDPKTVTRYFASPYHSIVSTTEGTFRTDRLRALGLEKYRFMDIIYQVGNDFRLKQEPQSGFRAHHPASDDLPISAERMPATGEASSTRAITTAPEDLPKANSRPLEELARKVLTFEEVKNTSLNTIPKIHYTRGDDPGVKEEIDALNEHLRTWHKASKSIARLDSGAQLDQISDELNEMLDRGRAFSDWRNSIIDYVNYDPNPESALRRELQRLGKKRTDITFDELIARLAQGNLASLKEQNPSLTDDRLEIIKTDLTRYLVKKTEARHAREALRTVNKLKIKLQTESDPSEIEALSNRLADQLNTRRRYDVWAHPDYLVLEHETGFFLRKNQTDILEQLNSIDKDVDTAQYQNLIYQLAMGSGKTKVLLPLLALGKADGKNLSTVVVPKELLKVNAGDLQQTSLAFGQMGYEFKFERKSDITIEALIDLDKRQERAIRDRKYMVTTSQSIQSLKLKLLDLLYQSNHESASKEQFELWQKQTDIISRILTRIGEVAQAHIDEVDGALDSRKEVNFSLGTPYSIRAERLDMVTDLYEALATETDFSSKIKLSQNKQGTVTEKELRQMKRKLARHALDHFECFKCFRDGTIHVSRKNRRNLMAYLCGENAKKPPLLKHLEKSRLTDPAHEVGELIALLKEELNTLLAVTLNKNGGVDYGQAVNDNMQKQPNAPAIPYSQRAPQKGSQFGNKYETLNYTLQMYLHDDMGEEECITIQSLKDIVVKLKNEAANEVIKKGIDIGDTDAAKRFAAYVRSSGQDLETDLGKYDEERDDSFQALLDTIKASPSARLRYARTFVLDRIQVFPAKISSNAQDFVELLATAQGFTGTLWNHTTYHSELTPIPSPETHGIVSNILFNKARTKLGSLAASKPEKIIEELSKSDRLNEAIIDIGAVFRGISNEGVADILLEHFRTNPGKNKHGVLFFDEYSNHLFLKKLDGTIVQLENTDPETLRAHGISPEAVFTYYDQAHTTGTDIKQIPNARATATLGENVTLRDLEQGVLRMRQLATTQKIDLVVPNSMKKLLGIRTGDKPRIEQIYSFVVKQQAERLALDKVRTGQHMLKNQVTRVLMKYLIGKELDDSPINERLELFRYFEPLLVEFASDSPLKDFGESREIPTQQLFEEYLQGLIQNIEELMEGLPDTGDDQDMSTVVDRAKTALTEARRRLGDPDTLATILKRLGKLPRMTRSPTSEGLGTHTMTETNTNIATQTNVNQERLQDDTIRAIKPKIWKQSLEDITHNGMSSLYKSAFSEDGDREESELYSLENIITQRFFSPDFYGTSNGLKTLTSEGLDLSKVEKRSDFQKPIYFMLVIEPKVVDEPTMTTTGPFEEEELAKQPPRESRYIALSTKDAEYFMGKLEEFETDSPPNSKYSVFLCNRSGDIVRPGNADRDKASVDNDRDLQRALVELKILNHPIYGDIVPTTENQPAFDGLRQLLFTEWFSDGDDELKLAKKQFIANYSKMFAQAT